jgi:hypothetical protein
MRKKIILMVAILLFMVSTFLVLGIGKNNYTARTIGLVLWLIVILFNIVRAIERWNEGK